MQKLVHVFGFVHFIRSQEAVFYVNLVFLKTEETAFSMKKRDIFYIGVLVSWEVMTKKVNEQEAERESGRFFTSVQPL